MTNLKKLPLGIHVFSEIVRDGYLYVDKTAFIHRMVSDGKFYFLSRPRRFGKSLLLSTLEALFLGRRDLFEGLYIEDKWHWKPMPVIRLDMLAIKNQSLEVLERGLITRLDRIARMHDLTLTQPDCNERFLELIELLAEKGKVSVLIDEYDKPILDQIGKPEVLAPIREMMTNFYAVLKQAGHHISFTLITGVSKFTKVSLFSELNNLEDLTMDAAYAGICGYTQQEMDSCLKPYLNDEIDGFSGQALMDEMRAWYNGYSWDGETRIYNPVSVMSTLKRKKFAAHWFETGTPRFLIDLLRDERIEIQDLKGLEVGELAMGGFEPTAIDPAVLLFQTGYLTIKKIQRVGVERIYVMDYPNLEVEQSFFAHLLAAYISQSPSRISPIALNLGQALATKQIDAFCEGFKSLFASLPYNIFIGEREAYYQTVIYLVLSLMGVQTVCEIQTNQGRVDAVLETADRVYVVEFKLGTAREAIDQIREKDYAAPWRNGSKPIYLLGIGLLPEKRNIGDWLCLADA